MVIKYENRGSYIEKLLRSLKFITIPKICKPKANIIKKFTVLEKIHSFVYFLTLNNVSNAIYYIGFLSVFEKFKWKDI